VILKGTNSGSKIDQGGHSFASKRQSLKSNISTGSSKYKSSTSLIHEKLLKDKSNKSGKLKDTPNSKTNPELASTS